MTLHPFDFESDDRTQSLRKSGFDDRAILDATLVVGYFNFVNRIVLALGIELEESGGTGYQY